MRVQVALAVVVALASGCRTARPGPDHEPVVPIVRATDPRPEQTLAQAEALARVGQDRQAVELLAGTVPPREAALAEQWRDAWVLAAFRAGMLEEARAAFLAMTSPSADLPERLQAFLDERIEPGVAAALAPAVDPAAELFPYVMRRAVAELLTEDRGGEAAELLRALLDNGFEDPALLEELTQQLRRLDARASGNPFVIGVLLPLTGPYQTIGQSALRSLTLAIADARGPEPTLVVRDTRGEAGRAALLAEELIATEKVAIVLGPVGAKESAAAAAIAQDFGVPMMVLSSVAAAAPASEPWIFRARATDAQEAHELARYAMQSMGLRTFAVLHPETSYGHDMARLFGEQVESSGGAVAAVITYQQGTGDFRVPVRSLKRAVKGARLDGLFVPDSGDAARRLGAYLRAAGLLPRVMPGQRGVQLIGGSGWLDPRVIDPGEGNTENALFTAAFFPDPGDSRARAFVDSFIARYAVGPTPFEAEAYDSARLALDALSRSDGGVLRDALRDALIATRGFVGVTGVLSMLETGQADRPLVMLTVQGDQIRLRGSEEEEKVLRTQGQAP